MRKEDFLLLAPHFQEYQGKRGAVLFAPGDDVNFAYFPCGAALASYSVLFRDGRSVETGLAGKEGAIGGIVSQGRLPAFAKAAVEFPGLFLKIPVSELEGAKIRSLALRYLFARYADCLLAQVFQSVACNATHSIEQRTAKWLLAAIERAGTMEVPLTQEQLAAMLGVGRSYLSRVIQSLKARRAVDTRRGGILVTDPQFLKKAACECNDSVRQHFEIVLKGIYPAEIQE